MLPDPNKTIRRATMVARGLGSDIGKASAPMGDADIVRQALNTLRHYARGGFAVGGYDNGGFPTAPTPQVAPQVSLPAGGGATSDAPANTTIPTPDFTPGPNTLDQVLGTNTPTMQQIFGFNYPPVAPVAPWPPAALSALTAKGGAGGSSTGTGGESNGSGTGKPVPNWGGSWGSQLSQLFSGFGGFPAPVSSTAPPDTTAADLAASLADRSSSSLGNTFASGGSPYNTHGGQTPGPDVTGQPGNLGEQIAHQAGDIWGSLKSAYSTALQQQQPVASVPAATATSDPVDATQNVVAPPASPAAPANVSPAASPASVAASNSTPASNSAAAYGSLPTSWASQDAGALGSQMPSQMGTDPIAQLMSNMANNIETVGQSDPYGAIGPTTASGDNAFGKYQIMGANIPSWTQEVLGVSMTPQELLANPQAQDAVTYAKLSDYANITGSLQGAAMGWFSGQLSNANPNAADQNGMTNAEYAQIATQGLIGNPAYASVPGYTGNIGDPNAYGQMAGSTSDFNTIANMTPSDTPNPSDYAAANATWGGDQAGGNMYGIDYPSNNGLTYPNASTDLQNKTPDIGDITTEGDPGNSQDYAAVSPFSGQDITAPDNATLATRQDLADSVPVDTASTSYDPTQDPSTSSSQDPADPVAVALDKAISMMTGVSPAEAATEAANASSDASIAMDPGIAAALSTAKAVAPVASSSDQSGPVGLDSGNKSTNRIGTSLADAMDPNQSQVTNALSDYSLNQAASIPTDSIATSDQSGMPDSMPSNDTMGSPDPVNTPISPNMQAVNENATDPTMGIPSAPSAPTGISDAAKAALTAQMNTDSVPAAIPTISATTTAEATDPNATSPSVYGDISPMGPDAPAAPDAPDAPSAPDAPGFGINGITAAPASMAVSNTAASIADNAPDSSGADTSSSDNGVSVAAPSGGDAGTSGDASGPGGGPGSATGPGGGPGGGGGGPSSAPGAAGDAGATAAAAADSAAGVGGGSDGSGDGSGGDGGSGDKRGGYISGTRRKRGGYIHRALHAAYSFENGGTTDTGGAVERALRLARTNLSASRETHR